MQNINEIYAQIFRKEISLKEGVKRIIAYIYNEPALFGLAHIDPDLKSDIIVRLLEKMPRYIANYSSTKAFFSTYIVTIILNLLKSEYRDLYRKKAHESSIMYYLSEKNMTGSDVLEDSAYSDEQYDSYTFPVNKKEGKKQGLKPKHMLILALKACYYLNESQIHRLAKMTGYTEDEILHYKSELEKSIQKRIKYSEEIQYRLNNSYMLKNRCFLQLMSLPPDSVLFDYVTKRHMHYKQSWYKGLRMYSHACFVRPTNKEIARVLNMKQHQVYQALRYIRELADKTKVSGCLT
ncbi:hypothetical protein H0R92_11355 [Treponema sp. OMZ 840]|uniref:hypothetical protein n=1 Tax=Treponema sp. OMZ 840 TaxID=244313 RepID=UPI003D8E269D